jgi:cytochrome P450
MAKPAGIDPMPPRAPGALPWFGAGPALLHDPTAFLTRQRERLGDAFAVDAFGQRLFFVFSPEGVARLYELPENEASFGLATYTLVFKNKVPLELLAGRRHRPHDLFGAGEVETYLDALEDAVATSLRELGAEGRFEVFTLARRLGHRLGLACWAGAETVLPENLDRLIPRLDRLDSSDSFVRPVRTFLTLATGKRRERAAMRGIEAVFAEILRARARGGRPDDFLDRVYESFADLEPGAREVATARDVMLIHMGAQSNLYAALGWTLVNLLLRPELLAKVRGGDAELLERCANESIRMAQRSLTLRQVLRPVEVPSGAQRFVLQPGVLLATMLSVTNTTAAPGLEHFDPAHYAGRRLAASPAPAARELVSTFGHGRHSCPAQRFSISAIRIAVQRLLERYDLTPEFASAAPRRRQIGGVARSERPCPVGYRSRDESG